MSRKQAVMHAEGTNVYKATPCHIPDSTFFIVPAMKVQNYFGTNLDSHRMSKGVLLRGLSGQAATPTSQEELLQL
jgi:hypothetical protein